MYMGSPLERDAHVGVAGVVGVQVRGVHAGHGAAQVDLSGSSALGRVHRAEAVAGRGRAQSSGGDSLLGRLLLVAAGSATPRAGRPAAWAVVAGLRRGAFMAAKPPPSSISASASASASTSPSESLVLAEPVGEAAAGAVAGCITRSAAALAASGMEPVVAMRWRGRGGCCSVGTVACDACCSC